VKSSAWRRSCARGSGHSPGGATGCALLPRSRACTCRRFIPYGQRAPGWSWMLSRPGGKGSRCLSGAAGRPNWPARRCRWILWCPAPRSSMTGCRPRSAAAASRGAASATPRSTIGRSGSGTRPVWWPGSRRQWRGPATRRCHSPRCLRPISAASKCWRKSWPAGWRRIGSRSRSPRSGYPDSAPGWRRPFPKRARPVSRWRRRRAPRPCGTVSTRT